MTLTFDWFLPTSGDGRTIMGRGHSLPLARPAGHGAGPARAVDAERPPDLEYLAQVARSAEQLGFEAVLTPTSTWCEDAWLATAALIGQTSRLKFLVAFRPGLISPTLAAQMAATYQRLSRGRLLLNVVTGSQAEEQRRFGDHLPTTSGTRAPPSSWPSCGAPGAGRRSTSPASTTRSQGPP
jgi:alkanesulfonate monooxygenase